VKKIEQPIAFDKPASQSDIEQADDTLPVERKRPDFELVDASGGEGRSDHCPDGATGDEIGNNLLFGKCLQNADVRPPARRTASEC
jgi:hypothetical protein